MRKLFILLSNFRAHKVKLLTSPQFFETCMAHLVCQNKCSLILVQKNAADLSSYITFTSFIRFASDCFSRFPFKKSVFLCALLSTQSHCILTHLIKCFFDSMIMEAKRSRFLRCVVKDCELYFSNICGVLFFKVLSFKKIALLFVFL